MEVSNKPEPFSATITQRTQQPSPPALNAPNNDFDCTYNEKDAYSRQQDARLSRASKSSYGQDHDSVMSHPFLPKASNPPSPTSSISSASGRRESSTPDFRDSRRGTEAQILTVPQQAHLDPEKHGYGPFDGKRSSQRYSASSRKPRAAVCDQGEYREKEPEEKAWQLLFYLSGPCALLSVVITLWTFVALCVSLALSPLGLCIKRPCLSTQLKTFLVPALNLQLHLVYSHNASTEYSAPMLVIIHLFGPIVAFGIAIAAWTAAGFWFFSSILGDPGGKDGHNDGKESIIGVRNYWERWLSRALRRAT